MNYYYVNRQNPNKVRFLGKTGHVNMSRVKEAANWKFIKVVSDEEKAKMILDIEKEQKEAKKAKELKLEAFEEVSQTVKSKPLTKYEVENVTKGKKVVIDEDDEDEAEIAAAQNAAKETLGKGGKK